MGNVVWREEAEPGTEGGWWSGFDPAPKRMVHSIGYHLPSFPSPAPFSPAPSPKVRLGQYHRASGQGETPSSCPRAGKWADAKPPSTPPDALRGLKGKCESEVQRSGIGLARHRGEVVRPGGELPAAPPAAGSGPRARLWSVARGGGGAGQRRLAVLFARASRAPRLGRPVGAPGGIPGGPAPQAVPGAPSSPQPDTPEGHSVESQRGAGPAAAAEA